MSSIIMGHVAALWDNICLLDFLLKAGGYDQGKRILESKIVYLLARIQDIESGFLSALIQHGKKRKRDDDISSCVTIGQKLVQEVRALLGHGDEVCPQKKIKIEELSICSETYATLVSCHKLIKRLSAHEKEAGMLFKRFLSEGRGPGRGNLIPTRDLFGQVASVSMEQLQALLRDDEIGRIAIHGKEGIGKTFLMKHLHNSVMNWVESFEYVFWVTFPHQVSIKRVQDAVAVALECNLCSDDSVDRRAEVLSHIFAGLGNFVLFLDNVPETCFSLARVGIHVPAKGSKSKVVVTTRSIFVSKMLDCLGIVNLDRLSDEDACQLLKTEAKICRRSALLLEDIPWFLATECCGGVPGKISGLATRMRSIDDPHEWRNALFEERKKLQEGVTDNFSVQGITMCCGNVDVGFIGSRKRSLK